MGPSHTDHRTSAGKCSPTCGEAVFSTSTRHRDHVGKWIFVVCCGNRPLAFWILNTEIPRDKASISFTRSLLPLFQLRFRLCRPEGRPHPWVASGCAASRDITGSRPYNGEWEMQVACMFDARLLRSAEPFPGRHCFVLKPEANQTSRSCH